MLLFYYAKLYENEITKMKIKWKKYLIFFPWNKNEILYKLNKIIKMQVKYKIITLCNSIKFKDEIYLSSFSLIKKIKYNVGV